MGKNRHQEDAVITDPVASFETPAVTESAETTEPVHMNGTPAKREPKVLSKRQAANAILRTLDKVEGGKEAQDDVLTIVGALR